MAQQPIWQLLPVHGPKHPAPVSVIAALNIPTIPNGNRFQTLSVYLPQTEQTTTLVGTPATSLPTFSQSSSTPRIHVHIHGGAWRDPNLTSASIEPAVAHAFSDPSLPITAIASLNYTLTHYPTHPTLPYDVTTGKHAHPEREAVHPQHVADVLRAFKILREWGVEDNAYVLTGHSAGACLSFQSTLVSPKHFGLDLPAPPRPAAVCGLNGLYDLPALVSDLGASHAWLSTEYDMLLSNAFSTDKDSWVSASPAHLPVNMIEAGGAPKLILLDQSTEDQLVPMNQRERLETLLAKAEGIKVVRGKRCVGVHAAPWEQGWMIWESVKDALALLEKSE